MPCYNCERTLEEAVDSIFVQNIRMPFEIVMVDDGSTDGTKELMKKLSGKHEEIKLFYHGKNRGGGATRNTAVEKSQGDIIFCLDGDDVLPPGILDKMIKHMSDNGYDGVVFEESRYFFDDIGKINGKASNKNIGRKIIFADLFDPLAGPLTTVNFLYTKDAFHKVGGYPTNHGFDTQGFGFRFLSRNLVVGICPGAYYFHRQSRKKKSYFTRVYENGEYSRNIYLIIEDAIFLFSAEVRRAILDYDIFKNTGLGEKNLKYELDKLYVRDKQGFFAEEYALMMDGNGFEFFLKKHKDSSLLEDLFVLAICHFRQGEYEEALSCYSKIENLGVNSSLVGYNKVKASAALEKVAIISELDSLVIKKFKTVKQKINLNPNVTIRLLVKIKLWIKEEIGQPKKRVIILWHNGGRLANQLLLFINVYAYCLDMGYKIENHCFFEYADNYNIASSNKLIDLFFFKSYVFLKKNLPKKFFADQHINFFRTAYKAYVKSIKFIYKNSIVLAEHDEKAAIHYLKPSNNPDERLSLFENSGEKKIYLQGWLFRNPVGIEKYRKEIREYFRPKDRIILPVEGFIAGLRKKYDTVIGVHIRQGDYKKEFHGGKLYFNESEVRHILDSYLEFSKKDRQKTCFVICSDGPVDENRFSGLNIVRSAFGAVEDLYLLSMTDLIIGSDSTFGVFAAYYGNIPFVVFKKEGIDWEYYSDKKTFFENKYSLFYADGQ